MKVNYIIYLTVLSFLVSCKKDISNTHSKKSGDTTETITALPETSKEKTNSSVEGLIASFIARKKEVKAQLKSLNKDEANALYKKYAEENNGYILTIQEKEQDLLNNFYNYYSNTTSPPDSIRKKEKLLKSADLELWELGEGYVSIRTEHDFYYKLFKSYVTPDYKEYLRIIAEEEKVLYSADAGIGVSWKEVGDRVLNWEKFLLKYPDSDFSEDAINAYKSYQMDYLFGMDNTPTMQYPGTKLFPENIAEFKRFIARNPRSLTSSFAWIMLENTKSRDSLRAIIVKEQESFYGN